MNKLFRKFWAILTSNKPPIGWHQLPPPPRDEDPVQRHLKARAALLHQRATKEAADRVALWERELWVLHAMSSFLQGYGLLLHGPSLQQATQYVKRGSWSSFFEMVAEPNTRPGREHELMPLWETLISRAVTEAKSYTNTYGVPTEAHMLKALDELRTRTRRNLDVDRAAAEAATP